MAMTASTNPATPPRTAMSLDVTLVRLDLVSVGCVSPAMSAS
jgi:hypothetical protein